MKQTNVGDAGVVPIRRRDILTLKEEIILVDHVEWNNISLRLRFVIEFRQDLLLCFVILCSDFHIFDTNS